MYFFKIYKFSLYEKRFQWLHWGKSRGFVNEINAPTDTPDGCKREHILKAAERMIVLEPDIEEVDTPDHGLVIN